MKTFQNQSILWTTTTKSFNWEFSVLDQRNQDILVKQFNNESSQPLWVNKVKFLQNKFVTLKSDKYIYNQNTHSNFIYNLISPIQLTEQVALTDFIYFNDIDMNLGVLDLKYISFDENEEIYQLPDEIKNKRTYIEFMDKN